MKLVIPGILKEIMMKYTKLILFFVAFLFSSWSGAQEEVWSLEKCILHSQEASIAINQAELGVKTAEVNLSQTKQSRLPNVSANTGVNWNFGRTIDPTSNEFVTETFFSNSYSVNLGVTLFEGMRINNSIKQSKLDLEASRHETDQTRANVALQVASNYLQVLFAKENIEVAEGQLELNRQQLEQTNRQITAGALAESENLNLEAQVAQSEQQLIIARNNYDIAMLQLKQVLRIDPSYPMDVEAPEGINITTDPDMVGFEDAFAEALKNRPDLFGQGLRVQSAELGVKIAKSSFVPRISAGVGLGSNYSNQARESIGSIPATFTQEVIINSPDASFPFTDLPIEISTDGEIPQFQKPSYGTQIDNNLSYGVGFSVGIPIYNNGATRSNVQRAKLNVQNQQLQYDQLVENLKITVQQSLADARAAKKKLEASEKALAAQKLAFDNTNKRLEIGSANTFEWEGQKTQMENAELQRIIDKYDYLFKLKILEFYLGKPLKL